MKILFYLPVVTPWWLEHIVLPLIRTMAEEAEVHVLVPPLWNNTGITPELLRDFPVAENVRWHIADDPGHPTLRTRPADPQGLIGFVRSIDPDYTFCRSADAGTPSAFPGQVRYLMESTAPPLPGIDRTFVLQKELLRHGQMPSLAASDREAIDALFGGLWKRLRHRFENKQPFKTVRDKALARMGLDPGRKVVALALEYAHAENFFRIHETYPDPVELLNQVASRLGDDTVLAVTDHPLNYLYADNSAVYRAIAALGPRVHLVPNEAHSRQVTNILVKHCDGLVVQNSKSIYAAAYFRKPILRLADRTTESWMNASDGIDTWFDRLGTGTAPAPTEEDVRSWFGFQMVHEFVDPLQISARELIDRVDRPFDRDRLAVGLERYERIVQLYFGQQ